VPGSINRISSRFISRSTPNHCLYAFSTIGQKVECMRENPKVCLEIEEIADKNHWTTVLVIGR
jgi:nitroimidazol reductase NimA-like FMN-containing flavoprotein (pyridoxamine 5'-phosphate oxidase superfamily)